MVDSAQGISNFHSPSDVIVDASMPAMIRAGGKMYGADGKLKDTKAVNPESTFSRIYQEIVNFCKTHGQFDPATMGTVPNVGLMAQQAEEYGNHDKTFEVPGTASPTSSTTRTNEVLLTQNVEGRHLADAVVKDAPIRDWVKLAVTGPANPVCRWCSGSTRASARERAAQEGAHLPRRARHRGPGHPDHVAGAGHAAHHRSVRCAAGTPSPRPATSCATTSPTCFPILELGTSARCCRSCR